MEKSTTSRSLVWLGIILILITGLVHLVDAPDAFEEVTYKGLLFIANGLGAVIAALGISRGSRSWGWTLGLVVAGGALLGYILSRTVGLPGLPAEPDAWLEPLGVLSLLAEAAFAILALRVLNRSSHPAASRASYEA